MRASLARRALPTNLRHTTSPRVRAMRFHERARPNRRTLAQRHAEAIRACVHQAPFGTIVAAPPIVLAITYVLGGRAILRNLCPEGPSRRLRDRYQPPARRKCRQRVPRRFQPGCTVQRTQTAPGGSVGPWLSLRIYNCLLCCD